MRTIHTLSTDEYERAFRVYALPGMAMDPYHAARRARVPPYNWRAFVAEQRALADAEGDAARLRRLRPERRAVLRLPSSINAPARRAA